MTHEEFDKFMAVHPDLVEQFRKDRRIWVSHIPSVQLRSFTDHLSKLVGCALVSTQIEPELEFVFYDPDADGNSDNELLDISHERAGDSMRV
ncbi:hypothetical protein [Asaia bogorensis]|uniref:Uncharacterized protein n=1 Tax=Asaia bogorensis NBRC 16594 TaxID=1231624 RepID=A0AAN4U2J3_9PROT|nr:hypothetical protein [Asaia bogorensis]MDR6183072.1 hypothetical protein [Asaia bogorensis NBRC 16594]BAT20689.1 hypothetical protein Asbog_02435 [Asaia bogorensis NBRC 16594]GBQ76234.1 hypothetical protein AA0311_1101 [Asaia bogorensis NBRC 16594]GEL53699.1 hypothetical protein ABO01nite_17060 [Asaia bogorensis NBRC 16594]